MLLLTPDVHWNGAMVLIPEIQAVNTEQEALDLMKEKVTEDVVQPIV